MAWEDPAWTTVVNDSFSSDNDPLPSPWTTAGTYGGLKSVSGKARVITESGTIERRMYYNRALKPDHSVSLFFDSNISEYPELCVRSVTAGTPCYVAAVSPRTSTSRPIYLYAEGGNPSQIDSRPSTEGVATWGVKLAAVGGRIYCEESAVFGTWVSTSIDAVDYQYDGLGSDAYAVIGVYDTLSAPVLGITDALIQYLTRSRYPFPSFKG